jgi:5-methyltetrahydropteroyltriglutamate--homocysteine methyltransferase
VPFSVDRFLTTHTGSLPRPDDVVQMMYRKEEGKEVDIAALHRRTKTAVWEVVDKQRPASVDIVNDGEMSEASYATYIKDRLSGFGGLGNTFVYQDLVDFPNMAKRVFGDPGRSRKKTPACNAPIAVSDPDGVRRDIENLRAAVGGESAQRPFMTAASPGGISLFFHNDYCPSEGAYLEAIAMAMKPGYEAIVAAGFDLQVDCPDLAMGRHIQYADLELAEFRRRAAEHVEALNGALEKHSPRPRTDALVLGQL